MNKHFAGFLFLAVATASATGYVGYKRGWFGDEQLGAASSPALPSLAEAEAAGRAQAAKDLAAGTFEYHDYGLSSDHQKFMGEILAAKYAVKLTSVGDCCLAEQDIAEAKAYNFTVNEQLKKKFNIDVFGEAEKEARAKVEAAGGPSAPAALIPVTVQPPAKANEATKT
jgi:hypothetical protein